MWLCQEEIKHAYYLAFDLGHSIRKQSAGAGPEVSVMTAKMSGCAM